MKAIICLLMPVILMISTCSGITTCPVHDPIYPSKGEDVLFNIRAESESGISEVRFYETISSIDEEGNFTSGVEVLLDTRILNPEPVSISEYFTKIGGYDTNQVIAYRFVITNGNGRTRSHSVTFAIRPYPVPNMPAPVYMQGDVDDVFDIILIPDTDVTDMEFWRYECRLLIQSTIHKEPGMRLLNRSYNFYINPEPGTATSYEDYLENGIPHQLPDNYANLAFAELRCILHMYVFQDYYWPSTGTISCEIINPQTFIHEAGHALFGLADEYPDGQHWQADVLPNNWNDEATAQAEAPSRGKTAADVKEIGDTGWYRMCNDTCPMCSGVDPLFDFDNPCEDRVIYETLLNAIED